MKVCLFLLFYF
uniref:Uncharacterized protein n=1 Tax=Anguilla anguilla TaxID=7936 RepID=A0A0E9UFV7_ANGAN